MTCDRGVPAVAGGGSDADAAAEWISALPQRHLAEFEFPEVTRALRALSSAYVERRGALARGAALDTAGKRAATKRTPARRVLKLGDHAPRLQASNVHRIDDYS